MVLSSFDSHLTIYVRIYFLAFFLSVGLSLMPKIGFAFFVVVFWIFVPIFIKMLVYSFFLLVVSLSSFSIRAMLSS